MNAGRLDKQIDVYKTIITEGEFKDKKIDKQIVIANLRACRRYLKGAEKLANNEISSTVTLNILIRYNDLVNTDSLILFESVYYDVISVEEIGRREGLSLMVRTSKNFK